MAGFGFNTNTDNIAMDFGTGSLNMGFGFEQAVDPQHQSFTKVDEGNTSNNFLFTDDEGIDTSNPAFDSIFSMSSTDASFSMPQNLSLDNTLTASTAWNSQLPPALDSYPMTPAQSFGSISQYQPVNDMGKRPLQLDVHDFPQAKRHEPYTSTSFSPFAPSPSASFTGSSWMDTQGTPASSVDVVGLSDEAADVCALWFSKYAVLPSDRHIDSLSQLTGEPSSAIRQWFGRLLKQGMAGHGDSAYKSQTSFTQQEQPLFNCTQDYTMPESSCNNDTTTNNPPAARGGKKGCTPTQDPELLKHDPSKIYQCTRKCGKRYTRKCDWKRNEEESYPSKSWLCSLCVSQGTNDKLKPCFRRYHFSQHFRNIHPGLNSNDYESASLVHSDTDFPRRCGFCPHRFSSRQDRIDHIAEHFKKGKCMLDWVDYEDDNNYDNTDDDDDDKPDNDGSDNHHGSKGSGPPSKGGRDSRHGGGNNNGGDGRHYSYGGFSQFQLSNSQANQPSHTALSKSRSGSESGAVQHSCAELHDSTARILLSEGGSPVPTTEHGQQQPICRRSGPRETTESHTTTLAGNAVAMTDAQLTTHEHQSAEQPEQPAGKSIVSPHGPIKYQSNDKLKTPCDTATLSPSASAQTDVGSTSKSPASDVMRGAYVPPSKMQTTSQSSLQYLQVQLQAQEATSMSTIPSRPPTPPIPDVINHASETADTLRRESLEKISSLWHEINTLSGASYSESESFLSVKLLGTGGFSTVDEVVHRGTDLRMSRKTLKNREISAIAELKNEVNVLKRLRHPHIVRFLGAYAKGDKVSILCSPVAESTLALWLKRSLLDRPDNFYETVFGMLGCLSSTVRYLHEQRPVVKHLDIKPQNILVKFANNEAPKVILSDFGISSSEPKTSANSSRAVTRHYCAPEVLTGMTREKSADIWSLGCVFIEMIASALGGDNPQWLALLEEFSGSAGKSYCKEIPRLHSSLSTLQASLTKPQESNALHTIKQMVDEDPSQRPTASDLTMVFVPDTCCLQWANADATFPGPNEELATVVAIEALRNNSTDHVNSDHSPACNHAEHQRKQDAKQDTTSQVKSWLDECIHDHEACVWQEARPKPLPTRLVDITSESKQVNGLSSVRVVKTADMADGCAADYVAISYMWSPSDLTLAASSVENVQVDFDREKLPAALRKAISVVERIGYRYIWIDSLCVAQDDDEDKRHECGAMASTYRNAAMTIIINDDNISPLTVDHQQNRPRDTALPDASSTEMMTIDWTAPGFAWDTRAWALQERLLSHRLLHLSDAQAYWECNNLKASETFPHGLSSLVWEKAHTTKGDPKQIPPRASRLRDCQWIKKEGDGMGDPMSSQTQLMLEHRAEKGDSLSLTLKPGNATNAFDKNVASSNPGSNKSLSYSQDQEQDASTAISLDPSVQKEIDDLSTINPTVALIAMSPATSIGECSSDSDDDATANENAGGIQTDHNAIKAIANFSPKAAYQCSVSDEKDEDIDLTTSDSTRNINVSG